ncbi:mandelate racemase/muconate lactonizing enzyme family protein [Simiduia agarivorans]|uniref:Mandelate racemase/muconate lactonizing protein n=1 Tax=Simiduia agarivorans (strain DSM 21679 / JCM 13881 / BCRC 17597 / SA1) TaxID=1117647 RepID=K4L2U8_SIMAS|nr:mandelate racemase/muconate lactonizing enzyme family protein [Simiduia agarivorans]AFV00523.1 mandelate racemase/muconate lactonizing protein [Simiduia agarivorans SA1 = DSM 21679]
MLENLVDFDAAALPGTTIKAVSMEYYQVPLAEVLSDAKHGDHTHFELIVCRITCKDGLEGVGYTYTGGKGGRAIWSLLEHDLKPLLLGADAGRIFSLWEDMQYHLHYVGRGGLVSFAISSVDIALWDLRCKKLEQPLWKVAGGAGNSTRCYAGGIDLNFPVEKLQANVAGYLARGFNAVKIKVGKPDYKEDVARVQAVRDTIGKDTVFMVDANYSLTVEQAIRFSRAIENQDITWFEEPTIPDDYEGYAQIADATSIPLAMGENLHTIYEFEYAIAQAKLGFLQPDASNIGGITGWLKVAHQAHAANLPVCSHGMHELHVSLMASQPHAGYLEVHSFPIDQYTTRPIVLRDGLAVAPDTPGTGVEFDEQLLGPHRIHLK